MSCLTHNPTPSSGARRGSDLQRACRSRGGEVRRWQAGHVSSFGCRQPSLRSELPWSRSAARCRRTRCRRTRRRASSPVVSGRCTLKGVNRDLSHGPEHPAVRAENLRSNSSSDELTMRYLLIDRTSDSSISSYAGVRARGINAKGERPIVNVKPHSVSREIRKLRRRFTALPGRGPRTVAVEMAACK